MFPGAPPDPQAPSTGSAPILAPADRLARLLADYGPMGAATASRMMGLHLTTVLYHLRRLQDEGSVARTGRCWHLKSVDAFQVRLGSLGFRARELFDLVETSGGIDHSSAAERLGISAAAVTGLVRTLQDKDLVTVVRRGRHKVILTRLPQEGGVTGSTGILT